MPTTLREKYGKYFSLMSKLSVAAPVIDSSNVYEKANLEMRKIMDSMIEESYAPGNTISLVARRNGINPNLLYKWRRQMQQGGEMAIEADDVVVSQAEVRALKKRIQQLERCLGDKTLEV